MQIEKLAESSLEKVKESNRHKFSSDVHGAYLEDLKENPSESCQTHHKPYCCDIKLK